MSKDSEFFLKLARAAIAFQIEYLESVDGETVSDSNGEPIDRRKQIEILTEGLSEADLKLGKSYTFSVYARNNLVEKIKISECDVIIDDIIDVDE